MHVPFWTVKLNDDVMQHETLVSIQKMAFYCYWPHFSAAFSSISSDVLVISLLEGHILREKYESFSSLNFERLSPFINNVTGNTEESLILPLVQATKRNSDAGARRGEPRLVNSPEKEWVMLESAGPGSDSDAHFSRISSKCYQQYSLMQCHHPHRGVCLSAWAEIEKQRSALPATNTINNQKKGGGPYLRPGESWGL